MRRLKNVEDNDRMTDKELMRELLYGDNILPIPSKKTYGDFLTKIEKAKKNKKKGNK